jgi:hypothetical protein
VDETNGADDIDGIVNVGKDETDEVTVDEDNWRASDTLRMSVPMRLCLRETNTVPSCESAGPMT